MRYGYAFRSAPDRLLVCDESHEEVFVFTASAAVWCTGA